MFFRQCGCDSHQRYAITGWVKFLDIVWSCSGRIADANAPIENEIVGYFCIAFGLDALIHSRGSYPLSCLLGFIGEYYSLDEEGVMGW